MKHKKPLTGSKLRTCLDPMRIPYETSADIPRNGHKHNQQQRALKALELGLNIESNGYNIYLSGEPELGRRYLLRNFLAPRAKKGKTPPDLVYAHNFDNPDAPVLLTLPPGQGRKLKSALTKAFGEIQKEMPLRLEGNAFTSRRSSLFDKLQDRREKLLKQMSKIASAQGFKLGLDDAGVMTLYPLLEGKRINEQEFDELPHEQRSLLKSKSEVLIQHMGGYLRKLSREEKKFQNEERSLEREELEDILKSVLDPLVKKFCELCPASGLDTFFKALREHTLANVEVLASNDPASPLPHQGMIGSGAGEGLAGMTLEELSGRFDINLFVDNAEAQGAPLIFEDHPTPSRLMGCIEREAELGALVTDFTLIRAGAIHRANGGYLIIHIEDMLHQSSAWEALLRALRAGQSHVEDSGDEDTTKAKGLTPQPVPLSVKVILVGKEDFYETLLLADERFGKLFKIKAHLTEYAPRNTQAIRTYLTHARQIIEDEGLLHFNRDALAALVDFGSKFIEDQQKLSLKFPRIREVMIEASAYGRMDGKPLVDKATLQKALAERDFRSNLMEEAFIEEYDRKIIKVVTDGTAVGRANGLAVIMAGNFEFGLPHQISCTVGAGSGGVIDLEREAQLGGPIHTKAMMILKSYLVGAFAHNKPLVFTGSLGFEQNYTGIEGDSASGAELAALLSALSGVPLRLSLAFTGSVSQSGHIMAVGGVNQKIEGFFEVCKRHGLTGEQGVLIPKDNCVHLMLGDEVVEAVEKGQFHIYAVDHITEAMELLTGIPSGKMRTNGTYTRGSLFNMVDKRLVELTSIFLKKRNSR